ncbi:hypothetical protein ACX27_15500 [Nostoc piscinale CENA21]|uniref:Low temperature-induced protein n=1 Tax=Nostoc piscinale CENA21 TaxID=224013 RepID=A0A0M4T4Y2_9NOSO|nr:hypothetical protein [Nostoc piscinale]ALF53941.1 hypothetical protein ACX27_15500 [Nostoc piscinale CENA21]
MKNMTSVLSLLRPVRFLIVAFTCALVLFSNAFPALAIESYKSEPTEATTQLLETQKKTDEVGRSAPPGLNKVQEESNKGLNEVQGDADIDKMKRPENSQDATSVRDEVENLLEKVTGKK